jgi:hypothetical protein
MNMQEIIQYPEIFRKQGEEIRSNWLYQKYAVLRHPLNLEHCINPSKGICLNAVEGNPEAAEFLPQDFRSNDDIIRAVVNANNTKDATRYLIFQGVFNNKWLANDIACMIDMDSTNTEVWMQTKTPEVVFHSRIPSGRYVPIQNAMKKYNPGKVRPEYVYMPHVFYRLPKTR